jgi:hypothetical protein
MRLGSLVVEIAADTASFTEGVDLSEMRLRGLGSRARETATSLAKYTTAAVAAGAVGSAAIVTQSAQAAKELKNLASIAGISASELQKLSFGAASVGMDTEGFAQTIKDVNDKIGDFMQTGAGPMADFFDNIAPKVGVTADQFRNLSGPQALQLYADSLEKANVSQADMTFYMEAIASDATALIPLLKNGGKGFDDAASKAERMGIVLSDIEVEQLAAVAKQSSEISKTFDAMANKISAKFAPVITGIIESFDDAGQGANNFGEAVNTAFDYAIKSAAFVMDAIEGVKRTFQIVADGIVIYYNKMFSLIASKVADTLDFVSKVPGVDFSATVESIRGYVATADSVVSMGIDNINDTLNKPMPGEGFKAFVADVVEKSNEATAAIIQARDEAAAAIAGDPATGVDALNAEQQKERLAILRSTLEEEKAIIGARYASEIEQINLFYQGKVGLEDEWRQVLIDKAAQFEGEITDIEATEAEKRAQIAQREAESRKAAQQQMWGDLASLMSAGSKKAFKIGQIAAISSATINGVEAAVAAWKAGMQAGGPFGPALAATYAAASLAKTGAMISSIKSQSYGGGGGAAAASGSIGGGSAALPPPPNTFNVSLSGINPDQMFSGRQLGGLVDLINEEIRGGSRLEGITI